MTTTLLTNARLIDPEAQTETLGWVLIDGATIRKGALVDGAVLLEADMAYQIDNMEGLDVWRRDDGALIVSLISDDNHSILQRNLYLEFVLTGE